MKHDTSSNGTGAAATPRGWATVLGASLTLLLLAAGIGAAGGARADDDRKLRVAPSPAYVQECGACHTAYPPGLLPAPSWQRLMGGLDKHFGNDASLDAAAAKDIGAWLIQHAGRASDTAPPQDRITLGRWFMRQHDEIGTATWTRASIKSASNCGACHQNAAQGRFSEHEVRIPK